MDFVLKLTADHINTLAMKPGEDLVAKILRDPQAAVQQVRCEIDYPRPPEDPRELPEIPELRLWFLRWDSLYPWLPYFLDWRQGELARYAAMVVPHQFTLQEGIQFHPEALELFLMSKIFVLVPWLQQHGLGSTNDLRNMAQLLGYDIDPGLFSLLAGHESAA